MSHQVLSIEQKITVAPYIKEHYKMYCQEAFSCSKIAEHIEKNLNVTCNANNVRSLLHSLHLDLPWKLRPNKAKSGGDGKLNGGITPFSVRMQAVERAQHNTYHEIDGLQSQIDGLRKAIETLCENIGEPMPEIPEAAGQKRQAVAAFARISE